MIAATLLLATAPLPHAGPPISATLTVTPGEVIFNVKAETEPLGANVGYDGPLLGPLTPAEYERAFEHLSGWLAAREVLRIDGVAVESVLRRLVVPEDDPEEDGWLMVEFDLAAPCESPPRSVSVTWDSYDGASYEGLTYIPVLVRFDTDIELVSLYPEEPQYVWHSRESAPPRRGVRPLSGSSVATRLPAVSVALGLVAACALLLRRRLGLRTTQVIATVSATVTGAFLLRGSVLVEVPLPWATRAAVPGPDQALEIFRTLHANIYEAFRADSEGEIYDLLATSVDPVLLDEIYGDVYESLVLREEGGAVCEIQDVESLASEVDLQAAQEDSAPGYAVDHTWRVHGLVAHWGHVHRRVNHYRATYAVRHDGESWKIAAVTVHDHEREDPDEGPAEEPAEEPESSRDE